jgi:hypothetical protein
VSYPPPPSQYPPPPPPPYLGGPPPAPKSGGGKTWLIVLLIIGFLLLACCGVGGYYAWQAYQKGTEIAADIEREIGNMTASPDTDDEAPPLTGPKDAFNAKVGDCLGDDPTDAYPEQQAIVSCSAAGATKIVKRHDGVSDKTLCTSSQDWYYEDFRGTARDFVVCMVEP